MPTSIREQLISAILTATGGIYDVTPPEDEAELPVTLVGEGEETASEDQYGLITIELPVAVGKAAIATDSDRDVMRQEAHALLASTITAMFVDETFGNLAIGCQYTGGGIQAEVGKFVFAEAQFVVRYQIAHGDPFSSSEP
jgi:hypothetical protein